MAITLSEHAASRVRSFIDKKPGAYGLRLAVKTTGCSGYAYVVDLTDQAREDDRVFESNGVRVVVDPKSLPLVDGTHIDFKHEGLNEGFDYHNPNVKALCGCGESFGI
ncbi:MAG: iron-sulfur cluster assembly accessory protein [Gammaproteobacteria bacterium]|nr:iron-sulfur cluster assembly accessory protein [Gammaproteobacteria bacterium]